MRTREGAGIGGSKIEASVPSDCDGRVFTQSSSAAAVSAAACLPARYDAHRYGKLAGRECCRRLALFSPLLLLLLRLLAFIGRSWWCSLAG
uniref:Uncharacterized protein n=1 Tax=Plectus sambesii TaxID=2011161 RepID=A0A914V9L3_9BILA